MSSYPVHLVCSSGGVKCFSYIGAVQKLKQNGIEIASVSACSMGSIIGSLIASGQETEQLEQKILSFPFSLLIRKKFLSWLHALQYPYAIYKKPDYAGIVEILFGSDITLGDLKIPFSAAALDLRQRTLLAYSSEEHKEMKLSEIIKIVTAIPPLSEPYIKDKRLLVDATVACESPVWMASKYKGDYPILVLKTLPPTEERYKKGLPYFINDLFRASSASHDYFSISGMPRIIQVEINCGNTKAEDFSITREQIERLLVEGGLAVEKRLKDFDGNFNNILHVEEIKTSETVADTADRAVIVARQMIGSSRAEAGARNQVFISYSHKDKEWLTKLQTLMRPIERFKGIKIWDDTRIETGSLWKPEIEKALQNTRVAVLLVTQNFFDSNFIQDNELNYFLEIARRENVSIWWIAISACLYQVTPLNDIQCANNPAQPLDQMPAALQNQELTNICLSIVEAMG